MRISLKIFIALYGLAFILFEAFGDKPATPCPPGNITGFLGEVGKACGSEYGLGYIIGAVLIVVALLIPRRLSRNSPKESRIKAP